MRRAATTACVLLMAAAGFAACGEDDVVVTVTQRTGTTAVLPPTTPTTPTTPTVATAVPAGADLEFRLPAQDSLPGLRSGTPVRHPTASSLVSALYAAGDSAIPEATRRLEAAGFEGGVLRDQRGEDLQKGLTLFRIYVYRVRDRATAQTEVDQSVAEVRATSSAPQEDVAVPGISGAKGLKLTPTQNGQTAEVLYVTWAAGRDVWGIQAFAGEGAGLSQGKILELAGNLYRAWNDTP